jgi:hypothetical protein
MSDQPILLHKAMAGGLPQHRDQFRANAVLIEALLPCAQGKERWLLDDLSLADFSAYMNIWYVRTNLDNADELLAGLPHPCEWERRIRAVDHVERSDIGSQQPLAIAAAAVPMAAPAGEARDAEGRAVGDKVRVAADDYGKTEVAAKIVSLSLQHVAIRRHDPRLGEVVVHFPRAGYVIRRQ